MNVNKMFGTLKLYQEAPNDKLMSLTVGVYKGLTRLYVNMSNKDFSERKYLFSLALTAINARMISSKLSKIHSIDKEVSYEFKLYGAKFDSETSMRIDNERTYIGSVNIKKVKDKNEKLINVIEVINNLGKSVNFVLKPTPYIDIYKDDVRITDVTELSNEWCVAYADTFAQVLSNIPEAREVEKPKHINQNIYQ